MSVYK